MPETLKTLMHETADLDFAAPDLEAITRAGDHAVRRRRLVTGAVGLAAAAVVTMGVVSVVGDDTGGDEPVVATPPPAVGEVTWALGSVLHSPGGKIDLGHTIHAYVRTSVGFVFADPDGVVRSVVDGEITEIGTTSAEDPRLVSDTESGLAAWRESGGKHDVVVFDQETGSEFARAPIAGEGGPVALDGDTLYALDGKRYVAVDLDNGARTVIPVPGQRTRVSGAEDGLLSFTQDAGDNGAGGGTFVGERFADARRMPGYGSDIVTFSTDGRYLSYNDDVTRIADTRTGKRMPIDVDGRVFATGYEWLDTDTVVVIAGRTEEGPLELLACDVLGGACEVAADDIGSFAEVEGDFQIPVGSHLE